MEFLYFFGVLALLVWGFLMLKAFYQNKSALIGESYSDKILFKTIFGKHYNRATNLLFGIIAFLLGGVCLYYYFS